MKHAELTHTHWNVYQLSSGRLLGAIEGTDKLIKNVCPLVWSGRASDYDTAIQAAK